MNIRDAIRKHENRSRDLLAGKKARRARWHQDRAQALRTVQKIRKELRAS